MKTAFLFFIISSFCIGQNINFFREDITFHLDSASFVVEGYYWFLNPSSEMVNRVILYPFPRRGKDEIIDSTDVLEVYNSSTKKIIDLTENGFYFPVSINPKDTALYRIRYRQKVLSDSVKYILRSTQAWGKPLETAEFKLVTDTAISIIRFSYPPDKTYNINKKKIYYWKRTNFLPERDMVFHLSKPAF
jgi:hypothetical protein